MWRWLTSWMLCAKNSRKYEALWVTSRVRWASTKRTRRCRPPRYCVWSRRRRRTHRWSVKWRSGVRWWDCRRLSCRNYATSSVCPTGPLKPCWRPAPRRSAASFASRRRLTTPGCGRSPMRSLASFRPSTGPSNFPDSITGTSTGRLAALKPMIHSPENGANAGADFCCVFHSDRASLSVFVYYHQKWNVLSLISALCVIDFSRRWRNTGLSLLAITVFFSSDYERVLLRCAKLFSFAEIWSAPWYIEV